ncbi:MAG: SdiA-regulated domain-containing protein [Pirellulaceae bacterium]
MLAAYDLSAYETNIDTFLANPFSANDAEYSGVAYSTTTGTLFVIDDGGQGDIYEYSTDGAPLREVDLDNFDSPEGIVHLGGNQFAILEEARREISLVTITATTTGINKNSIPSADIIPLDHNLLIPGGANGGPNDGPEGIAYDAGNNKYYIAKEKNPSRLFVVNPAATPVTIDEIQVPGITPELGGAPVVADISDIFFADGDLFVLSDQSQKVIRVDLATNTVIGPELTGLPQRKFEGIAFTPDSFEMFLVSDEDPPQVQGRRFMQKRNFTVYNPTEADLTSGSDLGVSTTDDITKDVTPTFTGTVPADSTVWVYVDGVQTGGPQQLTGGATAYSITLPAIPDGNHAITIKVGESLSTPEAKRSPASPALNITIDTTAPKIERITISGIATTHDPFDFDNQNPGIGSGKQLKTVPVGGANEIQIDFTEIVGVAAGSAESLAEQLNLDGVLFTGSESNDRAGGDAILDLSQPDAPKWTWQLPNLDPDEFGADQYILTVEDDVIDVAGNALDGEWTNPETFFDEPGTASTFPSGEGSAGGNFDFRFVILPGDVDRDNDVGLNDLAIMQLSKDLGGSSFGFEDGDLNGDGQIDNAGDYYALFKPNFTRIWTEFGNNFVLGDLEFDGDVDFDDIDELVDVLTGLLSQVAANGGVREETVIRAADTDDDTDADFDDIPGFVTLINDGPDGLLPEGGLS